MVDINGDELAALVDKGYLPQEVRDDGAAIKKAIEGVISDIVFELQSEPLLVYRVTGCMSIPPRSPTFPRANNSSSKLDIGKW